MLKNLWWFLCSKICFFPSYLKHINSLNMLLKPFTMESLSQISRILNIFWQLYLSYDSNNQITSFKHILSFLRALLPISLFWHLFPCPQLTKSSSFFKFQFKYHIYKDFPIYSADINLICTFPFPVFYTFTLSHSRFCLGL